MTRRFSDLVDIERFTSMMDALYRATGIPHGLIDVDNTILSRAGWQDICVKFHRPCPSAAARCHESDHYIADHLHTAPYVGYKCANGLMDYAAPIIIDGEHVATIFLGQFLHEPPDIEAFRRQAEEFGFDEAAYLGALANVPILPRERIAAIMSFFASLAEMLAISGMDRQRQLIAGQAVQELNQELSSALVTAERAVEARNRFLAAASHDLRQPLQAIRLFISVLSAKRPSDLVDIVARMDEAMNGAEALLNSILDLGRIQAGTLSINPTEFALGELLEAFRLEYDIQAAAQGGDLRVVPCSLTVRADRVIVQRIVGNLLANALKYAGGGRILLGCRREGRAARIEVWDEGPGVPSDQADLIFEEFYQIGNPERSPANGLGLGLANAKRLAELTGARLSLYRPPKGACFRLALADAEVSGG